MPNPPMVGVFLDQGGREHNARAYGVAGDGTTDDASALAAFIAGLPRGGTITLPPGTYRLTQPWVIDRAVTLDAPGAVFLVDHPGHGIVFLRTDGNGSFGDDGVDERLNVSIGGVLRPIEGRLAQDADATGVLVHNSYWGQIDVGVIRGFRRGFVGTGDTTGSGPKGFVCNEVRLGQLANHLNVALLAQNGGWATVNRFMGGRYLGTTTTNGLAAEITHVLLEDLPGGGGIANNTFYTPTWEGSGRYGLVCRGGARLNHVVHPYIEMNSAVHVMDLDANCNGNSIDMGRGVADFLTTGQYRDLARLTLVRTVSEGGVGEYYDGRFYVRGRRQGAAPAWPAGAEHVPEGDLGPYSIITFSGTPIELDLSLARRWRISVQADMPANSVTLINLPSTPADLEIRLLQSGAARAISPGWLAGMNGRPYMRPVPEAGRHDFYRVNTEDVRIMGHAIRGSSYGCRTDITTVPDYIGQIAVVGGTGYVATTGAASGWKQITA